MSKSSAFDFTDDLIKLLPIPETGRRYYKDLQEKGFGLYATPNGVKSYYLRKRIKVMMIKPLKKE